MAKDIGQIYKHSQSLLSNTSINAPVLSYSASKTSSYIELTITSFPSVTERKQILFWVPKIPTRMI